jgi:hypothetical protein
MSTAKSTVPLVVISSRMERDAASAFVLYTMVLVELTPGKLEAKSSKSLIVVLVGKSTSIVSLIISLPLRELTLGFSPYRMRRSIVKIPVRPQWWFWMVPMPAT